VGIGGFTSSTCEVATSETTGGLTVSDTVVVGVFEHREGAATPSRNRGRAPFHESDGLS
jgi:hypothetical protein